MPHDLAGMDKGPDRIVRFPESPEGFVHAPQVAGVVFVDLRRTCLEVATVDRASGGDIAPVVGGACSATAMAGRRQCRLALVRDNLPTLKKGEGRQRHCHQECQWPPKGCGTDDGSRSSKCEKWSSATCCAGDEADSREFRRIVHSVISLHDV
uniref:hypothetical protein n=1 Tax=Sinorhizobium sp. M14 TaxID=430451 RepID=UPI001564A3BD|nr:hypothetical protein [Sinorhizobium sp. M14]